MAEERGDDVALFWFDGGRTEAILEIAGVGRGVMTLLPHILRSTVTH